MQLKELQNKLKVSLINYNLDHTWQSHTLINKLREKVLQFLPSGLYDHQDLEHQVLFRLTTFDPAIITDSIIKEVIDEQYTILSSRLEKISKIVDINFLFRGLTGKSQDLNVFDRLILTNDSGKLIAKNSHRSFNVHFKKIEDEGIISLFTNELHYIHKDRPRGDTFGFFFSGDVIPWAVETTEPSIIAKQYKRDALLAHGIDPNKAIELTRFYTLPGAPINAISLMDGLITKYYKEKGIEALFTTTMPMYSKTKGSTIAGGINNVLLVKGLSHKFVKEIINDKTCFRHVTSVPKEIADKDILVTHKHFPTMFVVEVFKKIMYTGIKPIGALDTDNKAIYINNKSKMIEKESKFKVENIAEILNKIRLLATYHHTEYIRDSIWGMQGSTKKIRLRVTDDCSDQHIEAIYKYKVNEDQGIKTEIEEYLYVGKSIKEATKAIEKEGAFKEENSYEKMRTIYRTQNSEITLDIYPFGTWIEIEGEIEDIWKISNKLGYKKENAISQNADELYLEWIKKHNVKEMWDVRFGLNGKK